MSRTTTCSCSSRDVAAVVRHLGRERATIVGHDWGGIVAWHVAMRLPQLVENLVILNLPHPNGLARELRSNPEQIKNSEYARNFQRKPPTDPTVFFGRPMTPETLSGWVTDPAARKRYIEAFERSDFDAMLNYYKRNYPRDAGAECGAASRTAKGQDAGADVSRSRRSGAARRRPVRHMEVAGEGSHPRDGPGRRTFRAAGCRGSGDVNDAVVADDAGGALSAVHSRSKRTTGMCDDRRR